MARPDRFEQVMQREIDEADERARSKPADAYAIGQAVRRDVLDEALRHYRACVYGEYTDRHAGSSRLVNAIAEAADHGQPIDDVVAREAIS